MKDDRTQTRTVAVTSATIERALSQITQVARAEAVFGQPVERGEYTVIPCAKVALGLGLGGGSGASPKTTGEQGATQGQGEGAGGGGGANGRPMAVIVISRAGVRIQPIVDVTRVVVASMAAAGIMAVAFARFGASRQRAKAIRAFAFGRMMRFGRGGARTLFPRQAMKLPSATQLRQGLKR